MKQTYLSLKKKISWVDQPHGNICNLCFSSTEINAINRWTWTHCMCSFQEVNFKLEIPCFLLSEFHSMNEPVTSRNTIKYKSEKEHNPVAKIHVVFELAYGCFFNWIDFCFWHLWYYWIGSINFSCSLVVGKCTKLWYFNASKNATDDRRFQLSWKTIYFFLEGMMEKTSTHIFFEDIALVCVSLAFLSFSVFSMDSRQNTLMIEAPTTIDGSYGH